MLSIETILAILAGFFMAWGVGANDVANAMGTAVGSKALTIGQAIIIAAIFESLGAISASHEVTFTIQKIIVVTPWMHNSHLLIDGMLASLLASGSWLLIASRFGWPVSTTHGIIGAVVGFGAVCLGLQSIHWQTVMHIGLSWVLTPFISCLLAYFIFISLEKIIFDHPDTVRQSRRYLPIYTFCTMFIISFLILFFCLKPFAWGVLYKLCLVLAISLLATLLSVYWLRKHHVDTDRDVASRQIEKNFSILTILTACTMAFAHGSNDVANAIGPLAAIIQHIGHATDVPCWIPILGSAGIVVGLATYGHKVIATIGKKITYLTPSRSFAAQLATATTIILSSGLGLPVSTTQILVGAIMGVGMARGIAALNLDMIRLIFMSWVITLPAGALLSVGFFYLLKLTL